RGVRRDGGGERHRPLLDVRASPAALLWQVPYRIHAVPQDRGALQAPAPRGDVRAAIAGAGAPHHPDRPDPERGAAATRCGGGDRGPPHVDARGRGGETELQGGDVRHTRRLPGQRGHSRRVHGADPAAPRNVVVRLAGRGGVVTGAGRGIGRAIARGVARGGGSVGLGGR